MSSKDAILQNVRKNIPERLEKPRMEIDYVQYEDKLNQFIEMSSLVGGQVEILGNRDIDELIRALYPDARQIATNIPALTVATLNPDTPEDPHQLKETDLAVIKGELGVAENGAIWIPQNVVHRVVYFITEYLVIVLDKDNLVNNMNEAYSQIKPSREGFGVFISGPSKTADIEQALVVGAHGPKGLTVILT